MKNVVVVAVMVLSLAACGRKDEATAQPDPAQAAGSAQGVTVTGANGQVVKVTGNGTTTITGTAPQGGQATVVKQDGKTIVDTNNAHVVTGNGNTHVVTPGASVDVTTGGGTNVNSGGVKVTTDKNGNSTVVVPGMAPIKTNGN